MKSSKFINKVKTSINNQKQYKIFKSKQFYGILFLLLFSYLFIVSIVQIPGFTSIYSYTFGFLFGYYSYFIFGGFIYFGLILLFEVNERIKKFAVRKYGKVPNFSWIVYFVFVIGVSLIIESSVLIYKTHSAFPGSSLFTKSIESWWATFTSASNGWLPNVQNGGFIISLFIALIASWSGFPISIIVGIIFIAYTGFYFYYGSILKMIKNSKNTKTKLKKREIEEHKTKVLDLSFENNNVLEKNDEAAKNSDVEFNKTVTLSVNDVDGIFNIEDLNTSNNNNKFIKDKTTEFNMKNHLIQEFDVDKELDEEKKFSNPETFEFELDIFDTVTSSIANDDVISSKIKE